MILLIGPSTWNTNMKRLLTDRTMTGGFTRTQVATNAEELRGTNEWIEIVICTGGYSFTPAQGDTISLAQSLNRHFLATHGS